MPFIKILITEDLTYDNDLIPLKRSIPIMDAILPRYPEVMLSTVFPESPLCFSFHHAAVDDFNIPFDAQQYAKRKNKSLLSGSIGKENTYPLRSSALELSKKSNLVEQLQHPGYAFDKDPREESRRYANIISQYKIAIAGAGLVAKDADAQGPWLIAKHFEIPATGTVMLTEDFMVPYLAKLDFIENVHYITANTSNLKEKLEYWLDPQKKHVLEKIAKNGQDLVLKKHLNRYRIDFLDELAEKLYQKKQYEISKK